MTRLVMELTVFVLFALVLLRILPPVTSQECSLPDDDAINTNLRSLLISHGGEGGTLVTTLLDHHFTCLAVGSSSDQYREVSVAVRYTKNTESGNFTAQFTLRCTSGNFGTVGELDQSPPANVFNISNRRDCFICTTVGSHTSFTIDAVADCALCDSSCLNVGQGGCESSSDDCCPFFDNEDNSCTTSCDTNFYATSSSNYTCVCNLTCENGGTLNGDNCTHCLCSDGFTGTNCEQNIDDCAFNQCLNGICTDLVHAYSCTCQAGFTGTNCSIDIDNCASNPCVNGTCTDLVDGYICTCQAGFTGTNCSIDIDDCASNPCVNGTCSDLVGGYRCTCQAGFTGTNCSINIDDCASNPCVNGTCTDLVDGHNCTCHMGYTGQNCTLRVDPCTPNPCQNGSRCLSSVEGRYKCSCPTSWRGPNCTQCSQLREGHCESCNPGYILDDNRQCTSDSPPSVDLYLLWMLILIPVVALTIIRGTSIIVGAVKQRKHPSKVVPKVTPKGSINHESVSPPS